MSRRDQRWLDLALRLAEESTCRQRHGAVVVRNGKPISVGINRDVNDPAIMSEEHVKGGAAIHAEVRALSRIADARGCTLYVARVLRSGEPSLSKPCSRCQKMIDATGVKRVVFTV